MGSIQRFSTGNVGYDQYVTAYQFTDSDLQRLTYSEYYGQCCFKGGVFTQLIGGQIYQLAE
jgi:hypothetical protein